MGSFAQVWFNSRICSVVCVCTLWFKCRTSTRHISLDSNDIRSEAHVIFKWYQIRGASDSSAVRLRGTYHLIQVVAWHISTTHDTHCVTHINDTRHTLRDTYQRHTAHITWFKWYQIKGACETHCNTLQHNATHCNTLQHIQRRMWDESVWVFATWIRGIRHSQRSFPLIKWLFCGKWPMNVAHLTWFKHIAYSNDHIQMSFEYVMCLNHVRCATFIGHFPHKIYYIHIHTYIHVYNVFFTYHIFKRHAPLYRSMSFEYVI